MNRSESISKLAAALLKAQSQMGTATKDSKNPFYKSSYADLNAIREAVLPAANANGITVLQPMKIVDGRTVIETLLLHESGEWMSGETPVVVAKQNDPQAEGSGQSYARRYGLQAFFNVGAEDDDGEKGMGRAVKPVYVKPTPAPTAGASVTVTTTTSENKPMLMVADIQATPENPTAASTSVAASVEPLKKTSFRKPKPNPAPASSNGTGAENPWS